LKTDIIPAQRRQLILELIREKCIFSIHELADATGVSLPTIRRDLDHLARIGLIERSHGGATLKAPHCGTTFEPDYHTAANTARKEKSKIGRLAADRLKDNQSVIFDSSSTVFEAAQRVVEKGLQLTAVTNDIRISDLFASNSSLELIVCGGTLRPGSFTLVGEPGMTFLRQMHADVAVMGVHGIKGSVCCDTSLEIAYIKRHMVAAAQKVMVLADSSKFDQVAFYDAFDMDERFEIITEKNIAPGLRNVMERAGARVICAGQDGK
jgi:DeoR family transcriptional regulator of aga operon